MRVLGVLGVSALLALAVALLAGCALAWIYPRLQPRLLRLAPGKASAFLLGLTFVPWILGVLGVAASLVPSLLPGLGWDHCLEHGGHPHLCLVHGRWQPTGLGFGLMAGLLLGVSVPLLRFLRAYRQGRRSLASMLALGTREPGFLRLPVDQPLAFSTGLFRPEVCLSEGLLHTLPAQHLAAVLAHEQAHRDRRDGLRLMVAEAASLILPPQVRSQLRGDLLQATEQACDAAAARAVGGGLAVAEALLAASRMQLGAWPGLWRVLPAFAGGQLSLRVNALLDPPLEPRAWWTGARAWPLPLALLGLLALLSLEIHHALESLLGLLSH